MWRYVRKCFKIRVVSCVKTFVDSLCKFTQIKKGDVEHVLFVSSYFLILNDHEVIDLIFPLFLGVDEEDVIYDDEHWHDHCLICNLCNCRLSGTSFVIKDDKFLCSDCYQKTDDKRCGKCGKGFEPGAKR